MAQDLTTSSVAALPAVDLRQPSTLLLLPPWLATQLGAVSDLRAGRTIIDPETRAITRRVATIPRSKMPNGAQRAAIMRRIEELHDAGRPGPEQTTLAILGELVNEHASTRLDDDTADIKIGAYLDAVEDLPAWTIREAVRRWRRGEVSGVEPKDMDFAPKPARLRKIADGIRMVALGQASRLQRVLDAEAEDDLSEAQREANQRRLEGVLRKAAEAQQVDAPAGDEAATAARRAHLAELEARKAKRLADIQFSEQESAA